MKIERLKQKEITEFLNKIKPDSRCPFCECEALASEFVDFDTDEPPLHDTAKIEFKEKDGELGLFFKKKQQSRPTVRYTCTNCGYTLMFDYFTLVRRIREKKNDQQ